ncbi:hypothetical protein CVT24_008313, partial [Panaeolus cyanescens]
DGTLITQRLHFTQDPHKSRHVLGWYRLARELRDAGVSAVCLFDGKERSEAKSGEVQRRHKVRQLVHTRGTIEKQRFQRISGLKKALKAFGKMDEEARKRVAEAFVSSDCVKRMTGVENMLEGVERKAVPSESGVEKRDVPSLHPQHFLSSLYLNYCANISQLASIAEPTSTSEEEKEEKPGEIPEHVTTKAQHELSLQESTIWRELSVTFSQLAEIPAGNPLSSSLIPGTAQPTPLTPPPHTKDLPTTLSRLQSQLSYIEDKSFAMSSSFDRRTNVPSESTYRESKALLEAAGIPCIDAPSTIEAEAFASAIVLSGAADYVGSEDTDVLVYEAPMLKNITSRHDPLVLVSGHDVRTALGLSRHAFIDFALLLGTDFTHRIKNVGPTRALSFLKKYGTIEGILEAGSKSTGRALDGAKIGNVDKEKYLAQVEIARMIFGSLPFVSQDVLDLVSGSDVKGRGEWNDAEVRKALRSHGLEFVLLEMDLAEFDHTTALAGNYFGDDPHIG